MSTSKRFMRPFFILLFVSLIAPLSAFSEDAKPVWIKTKIGWKALYALEGEYTQFEVDSNATLQDATHVLLDRNLGLNIAFADQKNFKSGPDILESHLQWEVEYWKQNAAKVKTKDRSDLASGNKNIKVTELTLTNGQGQVMVLVLVGLKTKSGVLALSISPMSLKSESAVKQLTSSIKLVPKSLSGDEIKDLSQAEKKSSSASDNEESRLEIALSNPDKNPSEKILEESKRGCLEKSYKKVCTNLSFHLYQMKAARELVYQVTVRGCELGDALGCFNQACNLCVYENDPKQALVYLKKAQGLGLKLKERVRSDETLSCLYGFPDFLKWEKSL